MSSLTFAYTTRPVLDDAIADWASKQSVEPRQFYWPDLWNALRDTVFNRRGINVAEIGSTWLPSLVGMNALRPFQPADVNQFGGQNTFSPALWKNAQVEGDQRVWAIPWAFDARVIYYWADMLEAVGLDGTTAFQTPEQMPVTLDALRQQAETPWAVVTTHDTMTAQNIATWIWQAGGDFMTPDGRKTRFAEPVALKAVEQYYDLYAYMPQMSDAYETALIADRFAERKIAAVMSGPWFAETIRMRLSDLRMMDQVHAALPPGPPYLGGSSLVVFAHTPASQERTALRLIKWLVSRETQDQFYDAFAMLPVRADILSAVLESDDPIRACFKSAVLNGRSTPMVKRWGLVEEKLVQTFGDIWADIQTTQQPIADIIHTRLTAAANNLDQVLQA